MLSDSTQMSASKGRALLVIALAVLLVRRRLDGALERSHPPDVRQHCRSLACWGWAWSLLVHSAPALHPVVGFKSLAIAYYFGNVFVDLLIYEAVIKYYLNTAGILSSKRCTNNSN